MNYTKTDLSKYLDKLGAARQYYINLMLDDRSCWKHLSARQLKLLTRAQKQIRYASRNVARAIDGN